MENKSKILVIGGTGRRGKFIVEASAKAGHSTFALIRKETLSDPLKASIIDNFKNLGVHLLSGDLYDHGRLVNAIKQVDVVISTVPHEAVVDQIRIIEAIKEAGNVKRFLPSEFGIDGDRTSALEPLRSILFTPKIRIRRAVEAAGIPYTYVIANCCNSHFLINLNQLEGTSPPRDNVVIWDDGNVKAIYNYEGDVASYTIRAVDDPRTVNKLLYIRPPNNLMSSNDLVSLWEKKIGKTLEKVYMPEEEILKNIREWPPHIGAHLAMRHAIHVAGDTTNFDINPSFGVEASTLYPHIQCTSIDEYLDQFV